MKNSIVIMQKLKYPTNLFAAAAMNVSTGYDKVWLRDNIYQAMGMEIVDVYEAVKTYRVLLDILKKHEYKVDWAIREKPKHAYQYIHARYHPITFGEFYEEWGNKQNDAIGALLFKIADLTIKGIKVIRDESDLIIIQKLVYYLKSIEYWHDADNGMWEEAEELHASSVGACVAGLKKVKAAFPQIDVPQELIIRGQATLNTLLPRESASKETDLALLSLIWPYNVATKEQARQIIHNVEAKLLRTRGIIRYTGDQYYLNKENNMEAEWTMGLPWLAIIARQMGDLAGYQRYMLLTKFVMNQKGELPELYFGGTTKHNENSPLGWAQALYIIAMSEDV